VAKTFLPTPVFGFSGWGLLPILRIFPDMADMTILTIILVVPRLLSRHYSKHNN
jgi:hypothetical protein